MPHQVRVIAHRGASHARPENTLPAFIHAIELGTDMIEFDVRQTADGHPVVMHDCTVDRTTNGSGAVSSLTLDEIRALDAGVRFHQAYADVTVPTLDEVLACARVAGIGLDIQIYAGEADRESLTTQVVSALMDHGFDERAIIAGEEEVVRLVRQIDSTRPFCNLTGQRDVHYLERAAAFGSTVVQAFARYVTAEYVRRAHAMDITINVFYADHVAEMQRLVNCGVDGILTNEPELLLRLLHRIPAAK